jgi:uncharacterized protein YggU (UPF0235/DUF167 family)
VLLKAGNFGGGTFQFFNMFVKVKVLPCSKEELVAKIAEDALKVAVREKPENGQANARVRELVAFYFGVPAGKVRLVKGAHESHKIFEIIE